MKRSFVMSKIYVVGLGPGNMENMTFRACEVLEKSDVIIGYKTYIELVREQFSHKDLISSSMKKEVDRCMEVLEICRSGKTVSLISSGDAGIYGMAGIMLELAPKSVEIEVVPGVTASTAAASIVGAPIMHDHASISLSDLLTDWELIKKRVELASEGDFVISLYNPKSHGRTTQIAEAREIMLRHKPAETPVAIVKNAKRDGESYVISTLGKMLETEIDMLTVVIVGNSKTFVKYGKIITPRGYKY